MILKTLHALDVDERAKNASSRQHGGSARLTEGKTNLVKMNTQTMIMLREMPGGRASELMALSAAMKVIRSMLAGQ